MPPRSPASSSLLGGLHTGSLYGLEQRITRFLWQDAHNPDTRALRAGLLALSAQLERTTQVRREPGAVGAITRQAMQLAQQLRQHQLLLTGMASAWHDLYEFGAYQQAVTALRAALQRWRDALDRLEEAEQQCFADFERLAWRTLGEALLLLDLYQQHGAGAPRSLPLSAPMRPARVPLLARLRAWLVRGRL
ncbi:hypothetical protein SAMN05428957_103399 [Oryzisolibacter propanilivorax]|uniref:Uncharacterized protein n=1 Tax=Oryzisolibacter propanilivorax TaxID=1527607 RepID=A0A1G9RNT5_9BURK|nr:hypothetical protein SAMN05428957_103399 [Oryzisolibacter propanilivorax]